MMLSQPVIVALLTDGRSALVRTDGHQIACEGTVENWIGIAGRVCEQDEDPIPWQIDALFDSLLKFRDLRERVTVDDDCSASGRRGYRLCVRYRQPPGDKSCNGKDVRPPAHRVTPSGREPGCSRALRC